MVQNLKDLIAKFSDEAQCRAFLVQQRWGGNPVCPYCNSTKWYSIEGGKRFKCGNSKCYKKYSVTVGTVFHASNIPLTTWFPAMYIITAHKKGISSIQLAKDLGVTQKTAWFMLQRIRACFGIENDLDDKFEGICEADETFVGGKNKNRHKDKKVAQSQGRSFKDKTPVLGVLQRGKSEIVDGKKIVHSQSKVKCIVASNTKRESIQPFIKTVVERDSVLISDEWFGYRGLENTYDHHVVDHGRKQYVDFDNPEIHSNSMEGFWSTFKRSYNGTYNWWSKKHMQKYVDELVYRFNLRGMKESERFNYLILNSGVRTKYKDLTA